MQVFDSNGPDVRIRGTAYQVHEKYTALAKDAGSAGDRILAENYLQHAEHYQRLINSWALEDGFQSAEHDIGESEQPQQQVESGESSPQHPRREGFDPSRRRRHPYQQRQSYAPSAARTGNGRDEDLGLPASILGTRPAVAPPSQGQNARNDEMAES